MAKTFKFNELVYHTIESVMISTTTLFTKLVFTRAYKTRRNVYLNIMMMNV